MHSSNLPLVLASQSPRRRELLTNAGYTFEVLAPSESAECGVCWGESTPELVARLAYQKAKDVAPALNKDAILIACDTVADVDGRVLGKPENRSHAEEMIRLLRGREHSVFSGLCVAKVPNGEPIVRVAKSTLIMEQLSEKQIEDYLDSDDWCGKSGAFGYQDGHPWLRLTSGSADNVVGLPLQLLKEILSQLN